MTCGTGSLPHTFPPWARRTPGALPFTFTYLHTESLWRTLSALTMPPPHSTTPVRPLTSLLEACYAHDMARDKAPLPVNKKYLSISRGGTPCSRTPRLSAPTPAAGRKRPRCNTASATVGGRLLWGWALVTHGSLSELAPRHNLCHKWHASN